MTVSGFVKQPGLPPGQNIMTKNQVTTIILVLLGAVAQLEEKGLRREANFEANCKRFFQNFETIANDTQAKISWVKVEQTRPPILLHHNPNPPPFPLLS